MRENGRHYDGRLPSNDDEHWQTLGQEVSTEMQKSPAMRDEV